MRAMKKNFKEMQARMDHLREISTMPMFYFITIGGGAVLLCFGLYHQHKLRQLPTYAGSAAMPQSHMKDMPVRIYQSVVMLELGVLLGTSSLFATPYLFMKWRSQPAGDRGVADLATKLAPVLLLIFVAFVLISFGVDAKTKCADIVQDHFLSFFDSSGFLAAKAQARLEWVDSESEACKAGGNEAKCLSDNLFIKVGGVYCDDLGAQDDRCLTRGMLKNYTESRVSTDGLADFESHYKPFCYLNSHDASYSGGRAMLMCIVLLVISITAANFALQMRWSRLNPSTLYMFFGILAASVGVAIDLVKEEHLIFPAEVFQFVLLPPIVFKAGYSLKVNHFSGTIITTILVLAVFGTLLSAFFLGVTLWITASLPELFHFPELSLSESLLLGSILSAVDPVATLGLFATLGVETKLETIIEGEALVNDGMAIILYKTFANMQYDPDVDSGERTVQTITGLFEITFGSIAIGMLIGFGSSLFYRFISFSNNEAAELVVFFLTIEIDDYVWIVAEMW